MKWSEITNKITDLFHKKNLSIVHIDSMRKNSIDLMVVKYSKGNNATEEISFPFSDTKGLGEELEKSLVLLEKEIVCRNLKDTFKNLPESYENLCKELVVLQPLKSSVDYEFMIQIAEKFMTYRGDFTKDQERYLSELVDILENYEKHVTR